jgi:hypothetical protein
VDVPVRARRRLALTYAWATQRVAPTEEHNLTGCFVDKREGSWYVAIFIPADFIMKPPKTSCDPMKEKETIPSVPQTRANQTAPPKHLLHHDA